MHTEPSVLYCERFSTPTISRGTYHPTSATVWRWAIFQVADLWVRCWRSLKLRTRPRRRRPCDGLIRLQRRPSQTAAEGVGDALAGTRARTIKLHDMMVLWPPLLVPTRRRRRGSRFNLMQLRFRYWPCGTRILVRNGSSAKLDQRSGSAATTLALSFLRCASGRRHGRSRGQRRTPRTRYARPRGWRSV